MLLTVSLPAPITPTILAFSINPNTSTIPTLMLPYCSYFLSYPSYHLIPYNPYCPSSPSPSTPINPPTTPPTPLAHTTSPSQVYGVYTLLLELYNQSPADRYTPIRALLILLSLLPFLPSPIPPPRMFLLSSLHYPFYPTYSSCPSYPSYLATPLPHLRWTTWPASVNVYAAGFISFTFIDTLVEVRGLLGVFGSGEAH